MTILNFSFLSSPLTQPGHPDLPCKPQSPMPYYMATLQPTAHFPPSTPHLHQHSIQPLSSDYPSSPRPTFLTPHEISLLSSQFFPPGQGFSDSLQLNASALQFTAAAPQLPTVSPHLSTTAPQHSESATPISDAAHHSAETTQHILTVAPQLSGTMPDPSSLNQFYQQQLHLNDFLNLPTRFVLQQVGLNQNDNQSKTNQFSKPVTSLPDQHLSPASSFSPTSSPLYNNAHTNEIRAGSADSAGSTGSGAGSAAESMASPFSMVEEENRIYNNHFPSSPTPADKLPETVSLANLSSSADSYVQAVMNNHSLPQHLSKPTPSFVAAEFLTNTLPGLDPNPMPNNISSSLSIISTEATTTGVSMPPPETLATGTNFSVNNDSPDAFRMAKSDNIVSTEMMSDGVLTKSIVDFGSVTPISLMSKCELSLVTPIDNIASVSASTTTIMTMTTTTVTTTATAIATTQTETTTSALGSSFLSRQLRNSASAVASAGFLAAAIADAHTVEGVESQLLLQRGGKAGGGGNFSTGGSSRGSFARGSLRSSQTTPKSGFLSPSTIDSSIMVSCS